MSAPRPGSLVQVVLCPHPPLLFRGLGGLVDPVADLRVACEAALHAALGRRPERVVVVAAVPDATSVDQRAAPDVRRFGTTGPRTGPGLPLALGVGRWLLDEAGWDGSTELVGLDVDADRSELAELAHGLAAGEERTVVLLLGDGSARRLESGPGTLDERAFGFDAHIVDAVRRADARALAELDAVLADELMVLGRAVFRLLGELGLAVPGRVVSQVDHESDPFGVLYLVATWAWPDD
jgi:SAM-dependent methyltransferase